MRSKFVIYPDNTIDTTIPRLQFTESCFRWRNVPKWNALSEYLRSNGSLPSFKRNLKTWILRQRQQVHTTEDNPNSTLRTPSSPEDTQSLSTDVSLNLTQSSLDNYSQHSTQSFSADDSLHFTQSFSPDDNQHSTQITTTDNHPISDSTSPITHNLTTTLISTDANTTDENLPTPTYTDERLPTTNPDGRRPPPSPDES